MKIILASASERRRELLSWLGVHFEIVESGFDEDTVHEKDPGKLVQRLALEKAKSVVRKIAPQHSGSSQVARNVRGDTTGLKSVPVVSNEEDEKMKIIVIGADTVIYVEGEVVGKPITKQNALRILQKLSGRTHEIYTGVAILAVGFGSDKQEVGVDRSEVTFRTLSEKEMQDYVDTGEPLDKGGGYAIQIGAKGFVTNVSGSYTNVVGLPLLLVRDLLQQQGMIISQDVPGIIFGKTGYLS